MKRILVLALVLIAVLAAIVIPRKSVHAELVINAEPGEVWNVLTDVSTYSEWNPIFTELEGDFREGAKIQMSLTTSDGGSTSIEVLVEEIVPSRKLRQTAGVPGLLTAEHQWLLEEVPQGTRVIQHEEYRGFGVLFYDPAYVQDLYHEALESLKARLEPSLP